MGLPYVNDPAITRHLASFLKRHLATPIAILFNGGVFTAAALRVRVMEVLHQWFDGTLPPSSPGRGDGGASAAWHPLVLTNPSLDLAVAWGAAYFAWLKETGGRRIGGGIARSYYIGIAKERQGNKETGRQAEEAPVSVFPCLPVSLSVLCVVPQHLEEGQEIALEKPELELSLGQPVMFPLYTSTVRASDKAGDLLEAAPTQLLQLPPLHTILRGGKRSGTKSVPVTLAARCTEIGTLELYCVGKEANNRWRLEFNVRDIVRDAEERDDKADNVVTDVWPEELVQAGATRTPDPPMACWLPQMGDKEKRVKPARENAVSPGLPVSASPLFPFCRHG